MNNDPPSGKIPHMLSKGAECNFSSRDNLQRPCFHHSPMLLTQVSAFLSQSQASSSSVPLHIPFMGKAQALLQIPLWGCA